MAWSEELAMQWTLLLIRVAAEPSRHRVAVWRELRRAGAVSLGPSLWAVPAVPVFAAVVERAGELARRGDGQVLVFDAQAHDEATGLALEAAFRHAREDEWAEFVAECGKFEAEIAKELRKGKLTAAELEEEEHSLERLRRWYRDLKMRDVLGLAAAATAETRLKSCVAVLEDYAERVYQALHGPPSPTTGGERGDA
jgi:hypothetical protein